MAPNTNLYLVSACLVGLCTRYDGNLKANEKCLERLQSNTWIPVCPEQLGGLPTPRQPADISGGNGHDVLDGRARVICKDGEDVTEQFVRGAEQVLVVAKSQNVSAIYLKSRSPSCAVSGCPGVTAALLERHGYHIEEF